jgi:hypothetical protein
MQKTIIHLAKCIVIKQLNIIAREKLPKHAAFAEIKAMAHSFHAHNGTPIISTEGEEPHSAQSNMKQPAKQRKDFMT